MVIADPEIHHLSIKEEHHDFIVLGCDGIFDRLNTDQSCQEIWTAQMNHLVSFNQQPSPIQKGHQFTE